MKPKAIKSRVKNTVSKLLKKHNSKDWGDPKTWQKVSTKAQARGLVNAQQMGRTPGAPPVTGGGAVPFGATSGGAVPFGATSGGGTVTSGGVTAPNTAQEIAAEAAKYVPTRDSFRDKFGTLEQLTPTAAFLQFASQQVTPEILRMAVKQREGRGWGGSGGPLTGYGEVQRQGEVEGLERERNRLMKQYQDDQSDLFTDWYGREKESYMTSADPQWKADWGGLGDLGYAAPYINKNKEYSYEDIDFGSYLRPGISGYSRPTSTYGKIV